MLPHLCLTDKLIALNKPNLTAPSICYYLRHTINQTEVGNESTLIDIFLLKTDDT